jgi:hypothetical protein
MPLLTWPKHGPRGLLLLVRAGPHDGAMLMTYASAGWLLSGDGVGPQPRPESLQLRVERAD